MSLAGPWDWSAGTRDLPKLAIFAHRSGISRACEILTSIFLSNRSTWRTKKYSWRHFQMNSTQHQYVEMSRHPLNIWTCQFHITFSNQRAPTGSVVSSFCVCLTAKTSDDAADAVKASSCQKIHHFLVEGRICHKSWYPAHVVISLQSYYLS
jgi:hypothetical protein